MMLEYDEASGIILDSIDTLGIGRLEIEKATGYVISEDIVSDISVLPFRSSAMDGFALRSEWIETSSASNPTRLPIAATVFAGDSPSEITQDSKAVKIMTGAPVPDFADTVVKFEDTTYDENSVIFKHASSVGDNIRLPGENVTRGETVYRIGHRLRSLDIGILASIGLSETAVFKKPAVLVMSTGNELIPPGKPLKLGQVYNSNRYTIHSLIQPFVESIDYLPVIRDDPGLLREALDSRHDAVITSGGVSAGERDMVISAAEQCGWTPVFHKVRVKPGKPVFFARRGKQFLLGLPGNPLSAAVTCAIFVIPALKKMAGRSDYLINRTPARLKANSFRKCKRTLIWPGRIYRTEAGRIAEFSSKTSSAALSALIGSDGLIFQESWDGSTGSEPGISAVRWERIFG